MAKFNSQISTRFIVVALVCAFVPAFSVEEVEANLLWNTCLVKITPKCALDIIAAVFKNGTMSDPCCNDLVKEGKCVTIRLLNILQINPC
ncbi:putative Prolamin-like domain-containing protein [Arabidopsis thaliana]